VYNLTETIDLTIKANIDLDREKLDFWSTLEVLEKGGLISRTSQGKICLTKKGKSQQLRGFSVMTSRK
jgi:hypothetical protein